MRRKKRATNKVAKKKVRRQKPARRRVVVVDGKKVATKTVAGGKKWIIRRNRKYPRCQARKTDGEQCGRASTKGKLVCSIHGGAKNIGRPPTHGLYSKKVQADFRKAFDKMENMPFDAKEGLKKFAMFSSLVLQKIAKTSDYPESFTRMVEVGSSATERYLKAQGMIPASLLPVLFRMMMGVVQKCFKNPDEIKLFHKEIGNLQSRVLGELDRKTVEQGSAIKRLEQQV